MTGLICVPAKKRNGTAPSHNCRANRSVARKVLQSLESLKLVEKDPNTGSVVSLGFWGWGVVTQSFISLEE